MRKDLLVILITVTPVLLLVGCSQHLEMEAKQSSIFERAEVIKCEITGHAR
ncbi:MAG: hypothetical protein ACOCV3_07555 [Halanaerobiales bacterium]